jgi:L-ascorbate metabolism protein UlaG (beta-lactamase superfamily)
MSQPLTIRRIGWAGYEVTTEGGTRVVIDPYLHGSEGRLSGLPESPITVEELADAAVVAVTHAGYDHRAQAIDIALAGEAILVSGPALSEVAVDSGVPADRSGWLLSGCTFQHADVTIRSLPARHWSGMRWKGQFVADQPMSFMLTTAGGSRIFCGGDTSLSSDMQTWGELYAPHVAVLGIGGVKVGPVQIVELPPADAAIAAEWLGVSHVLPVHYAPGDPAADHLRHELAQRGSVIDVVPLEFGDTWTESCPSDSSAATHGSPLGGPDGRAHDGRKQR